MGPNLINNSFPSQGILGGLKISHFPRINQMILYVSKRASRIYHIVLERGRDYSLCGLKVRAADVTFLEEPQKGVLCRHCERLSKSEVRVTSANALP